MKDMKKLGVQMLSLFAPMLLAALVSKAQGAVDKVVAKHG